MSSARPSSARLSSVAAASVAGWLRGGVHDAGQGYLQAGSWSKQEVVSFLPVFVPMPANFLWEEKCILQYKEKIVTHNGKGQGSKASE